MYLKPDYDLEIFSYILLNNKSHYSPCIQYLKGVGLIVGLLLCIKIINLYLSNAYLNRLTSSFTANLIKYQFSYLFPNTPIYICNPL